MTVTGELVQVWPPSVLCHSQRALPPLPCCEKARMTVPLFETAQPPSWKTLPEPPLKVVQVCHCVELVGSVMRCHCRDCWNALPPRVTRTRMILPSLAIHRSL